MSIKSIKDHGFTYFTNWTYSDGKIRLKSLEGDDESSCLYTFIIRDEVLYVGQTGRRVRDRMDNYRDSTEEQNSRIRELIKGALLAGEVVQIWKHVCKGDGLRKEEEARLRDELDPGWNRQ